MPACERCWGIYSRRAMFNDELTYGEVVTDEERRNGGPCSPEEQCGDMHLVLDFKDGSRRCRCGKVVDKEASDGE